MGTHVITGSAHRRSTTTPPGSGAVSTYWTQQGCPPKMSMTHKGNVKPTCTECNVLHLYWGVHRPTSPLMSAHNRQNRCKCIFLITQPSVSSSLYHSEHNNLDWLIEQGFMSHQTQPGTRVHLHYGAGQGSINS